VRKKENVSKKEGKYCSKLSDPPNDIVQVLVEEIYEGEARTVNLMLFKDTENTTLFYN